MGFNFEGEAKDWLSVRVSGPGDPMPSIVASLAALLERAYMAGETHGKAVGYAVGKSDGMTAHRSPRDLEGGEG